MSAASLLPEDVPSIKETELLKFESIPIVRKVFPGAKDKKELAFTKTSCQEWVSQQVNEIDEKSVFKYFCSIKTDVVARRYVVTATVVLKNW